MVVAVRSRYREGSQHALVRDEAQHANSDPVVHVPQNMHHLSAYGVRGCFNHLNVGLSKTKRRCVCRFTICAAIEKIYIKSDKIEGNTTRNKIENRPAKCKCQQYVLL